MLKEGSRHRQLDMPINGYEDLKGLSTQGFHKVSTIWTGGSEIINRFPAQGRPSWQDVESSYKHVAIYAHEAFNKDGNQIIQDLVDLHFNFDRATEIGGYHKDFNFRLPDLQPPCFLAELTMSTVRRRATKAKGKSQWHTSGQAMQAGEPGEKMEASRPRFTFFTSGDF